MCQNLKIIYRNDITQSQINKEVVPLLCGPLFALTRCSVSFTHVVLISHERQQRCYV